MTQSSHNAQRRVLIRRQALGNARWFANREEKPEIIDDEIRRAFNVAPTRRRHFSDLERDLTPEDLVILQAQQRRKPPLGKRQYLENLNI